MKAHTNIPSTLLILLWIYTGLDKLLRFESSRNAFRNQTFPSDLAEAMAYAIPATELLLAGLLLFSVSRWWGYLSSILLLTVFTTYIGLVWVGAFPRVPCNCAGIFNSLSWPEHFLLNMLFIGISIYGLYQTPPTNLERLRNRTKTVNAPGI